MKSEAKVAWWLVKLISPLMVVPYQDHVESSPVTKERGEVEKRVVFLWQQQTIIGIQLHAYRLLHLPSGVREDVDIIWR